ncbi:Methyltransferase ctvB [Colletotrichum sidae]|uniref:Methyltransferase ctvB n=1 Tax=Colletotrichum sidae TaxID=1347389 RepID=A0A4V3I2E9_9PEZI|nr:Methyltransferase ctvB [Colletotrichum sidae]
MGKAELGNAVYFPLFLRWAYDTLILGFICPYAWGCPQDILQGHYSKHVGPLAGRSITRLLDIGVGTGHFVEHAPLPSGTNVLLADINKNPLSEAQGRIRRAHKDVTVDTVLANVFELGDERSSSSQRLASCVRDEGDDAFDVISCMLLLHCLPGMLDGHFLNRPVHDSKLLSITAHALIAILDAFMQPGIEKATCSTAAKLDEMDKTDRGWSLLHACAAVSRDKRYLR